MKLDPRLALLVAESSISQVRADPIKAFRFSSKAQRRFAEAFHKFREVYLRAGNQAGKTHVAAHFFVALMRGCKFLDGVPLPMLGAPLSGVVLAQGRAMAVESVIKAVRRAVGEWPHHIEKNGTAIAAIWVKPDNATSDQWQDWSVMRFFVEDGQSVEGMRLDFAWSDEPPKWDMWTSLRTRSRGNRAFLRAITATPLDKKRWKPLREDFKGCQWPHGRAGKVEIRLSVYDNAALSKEHLRQLEEDTRGPLQKAKILGDYIDITGTNPFDADGLKRWMERCVAGTRHSGISPGGRPYEYETWAEPKAGEGYFIVADPSAGIEDEAHEHDPGGIVVVSRSIPYTVVARYNGYLASRDLGWLGAKLATQYNRGMLVWEHNSGYGESFWEGTNRYGNVYVEFHGDRRRLSLSERIGWLTTATTRGTIIGALQKAILQDGLVVFSADAVDSLGSVVLKRDGLRPEAGAGAHDEDMIILGLACHLLETIPYYAPNPEKGSDRLMKDLRLKKMYVPEESDPFSNPW